MKCFALAMALSLVACNATLQFDDGADAPQETGGSCSAHGCPLFSQRCEPTSGQCVECLHASDCPGALVCDVDVHVCVECLQDTDCNSGDVCITSVKRCARQCTDTPQCNPTGTGDDHCDTSRTVPICVECAGDSDCAAERCDLESCRHSCELASGHCVDCVSDVTCTSPTRPRCDRAFFKCVQCLSDGDCPDAAPYCDPTHHQCVTG